MSDEEALIAIGGQNETEAVGGIRCLLAPSELIFPDEWAKWRNRWDDNPQKVLQVFTQLAEDRKQGWFFQAPSAYAEALWGEFA